MQRSEFKQEQKSGGECKTHYVMPSYACSYNVKVIVCHNLLLSIELVKIIMSRNVLDLRLTLNIRQSSACLSIVFKE